MDLGTIIDEIAGQADDFLAGATSRQEARAAIAELISARYPLLGPVDHKKVAAGVMSILESEGFFDSGRSGGLADDPGAE